MTFLKVLHTIEGKGLVKAKGVAEVALGVSQPLKGVSKPLRGVSITFPHKSGNLFCSVGRQRGRRGIGEGKREKN